MRKLAVTLLSVGAIASTIVVAPGTAFAEEGECPKVDKQTKGVSEEAMWGQKLLDANRVWSTTKGKGATVAVIDSGVDKTHPLLEGRVSGGKAYIHNTKNEKPSGGDDATEDCDGHGTEVAGIIAGGVDKKTGFHGIAPEAEIIPYRISNARPGKEAQPTEEDDEEVIVTSEKFAAAIKEAVKANVDVINLSVKYSADYPAIKGAIEEAVNKGVIVVAAAGNAGEEPNPGETYPANYPGVIGVGAVDNTLSKVSTSQSGPWVDIVAPGLGVAAPLPNKKYDPGFGGTSGATAFVSGTAALLVAQHKGEEGWNGERITKQILATASPTPGGSGMNGDKNVEGELGMSNDYGHGLVDPYMAVTKTLDAEEQTDQSQMDAPEADPAAVERNAAMDKMRSWALWIGLGSLGVFVAVLTGVGALRRGKKTGWHVKKVDRSSQIEHFDDGDPIPLFQGIKGLKE